MTKEEETIIFHIFFVVMALAQEVGDLGFRDLPRPVSIRTQVSHTRLQAWQC